jgi:hypothetical protein
VSFIAEKPPTDATDIIPLKKQGAKQSGKKKSAEDLASPSDYYPGLAALLSV